MWHSSYRTNAPAANLTVSISWSLPLYNADGSTISPAIIDQRIMYDTISRSPTGTYSYSKTIGDGTSTSTTITGLSAGTYYFAHQTYNGLGWSELSPEFSKDAA